MGAAGDMLMAALLEVHPDPQGFMERFNALGLPGVLASAQPCVRCGITGTHVSISVGGVTEESEDIGHIHEHGHCHVHSCEPAHEHKHEHDGGQPEQESHRHTGLTEIERLVDSLALPEQVQRDVRFVYHLLAEAESRAHGKPVEQIHFHEVGTMDAVADITGVCWLMHELAPERVLASPVHVGSGQVRCAHGILPVPAPAAAYLLQGIPIYGGAVRGELCTPTGAALLKYFVSDFGPLPEMRLSKIGYGMGSKEFECLNCVRALLGETRKDKPHGHGHHQIKEGEADGLS
ncbi:MAG: hypothetical protein H6Q60_185 [Oscillospiraceae bacterium]|nr:hypothetical protein [Oscillospiraceae bacterium]